MMDEKTLDTEVLPEVTLDKQASKQASKQMTLTVNSGRKTEYKRFSKSLASMEKISLHYPSQVEKIQQCYQRL